MFAKLFGTDDDQILIMIDEGETGPEVSLRFKPEGLGVCSFGVGFKNSDEGWNKAEEMFKSIDEAKAKEMVAKAVIEITGQIPADAKNSVH